MSGSRAAVTLGVKPRSRGGAGTPQVIAYVTAWALFAVQRPLQWKFPVMPTRLVWLRLAAALPLPFLAALIAMALGRP